ncbi:MAG: copper amine oxidase N-terminal domain-containing protein, partial [Defluviitaleaceae bacterium]|nr:copper amine oxidase N-terminal domain-containing protein [Defluviitaleaceae bacterium]
AIEPIVIEGEDGYQGVTTLPAPIAPEEGYMGIVSGPLELTPEEIAAISWETEEDEVELTLNGDIVVNGELIESAYAPFIEDGIIMVPLRVVAEALGYDVSWNSELRSVQLGVAVQLWIGQTEAHFGRMAPIALSTAPVIVESHTFVPMDFFRNVLNLDAFWFEGQVVIAAESDMQ